MIREGDVIKFKSEGRQPFIVFGVRPDCNEVDLNWASVRTGQDYAMITRLDYINRHFILIGRNYKEKPECN